MVLAAAVSFAGIASHSLWTPDEPRDASFGKAMLATGEMAVPRLNGQPFMEKPPLTWWLQAAAYRMLGVSDTVARVPSALCAALTLLATFLLARRLGGARAGWLAAGALASTAEFSEDMRRAIVDPPLVLVVTLTYCGFVLLAEAPAVPEPAGRRQRRAGYALIAAAAPLSFMAKAMVGIGLALGPPVLYLAAAEWLHRRRRPAPLPTPAVGHGAPREGKGAPRPPSRLIVGPGRQAAADGAGGKRGSWPWPETSRLLLPLLLLVPLLLAAVALPWGLAVVHDAGWPALRECLIGNTVGRLFATTAGERYGHRQPFWYYLTAGLPALLPWSLALPAVWFHALRQGVERRTEDQPNRPAERTDRSQPSHARPWNGRDLLPACFLLGVAILSVAASKRTVYLVPLLPALAVPLGLYLDRLGPAGGPAPLSRPDRRDPLGQLGQLDQLGRLDQDLEPTTASAGSRTVNRWGRWNRWSRRGGSDRWDRATALLLLALLGAAPLLLWLAAAAAARGRIHGFPAGLLHAELTAGRLAAAGAVALAATALLLLRLVHHLRAGTTPTGAWLVLPALGLTLAYHTAVKAAVEPLKDPHALTAAVARLDPGTGPVAAYRPSETTLGILYLDLGRAVLPLATPAELAAWFRAHPQGRAVLAGSDLRRLPPALLPRLQVLYDETATRASPFLVAGWRTGAAPSAPPPQATP